MLDEFDLKLIKALRKNGRASYVELAKGLGVVEGTVRKRVNELLRSGVIRVSAIPDLRALGYNFISLIGLQINMSDLKNVSLALAGKPNICYLAFVTGRYDLLAIVACRSTDELARVIEADIAAVPGILRSETFINLDIVKGGLLEFDVSDILDSLFSNTSPESPHNKRK